MSELGTAKIFSMAGAVGIIATMFIVFVFFQESNAEPFSLCGKHTSSRENATYISNANKSYFIMKFKSLTTANACIVVTLIGAELVFGGLLSFTFTSIHHQASAQMMVIGQRQGGGMMSGPNMMRGPGTTMMSNITGTNITGSIPIFPTISKAIASQVHTSLVNASMTAEKTVGGDAHAVSSHLGVENGFLVYTIWTIDSNNNIHRVIVDAGDGTVLLNQQISMREMMMHGGGIMMMGPPSMGMMGPDMMMGHHGMMWKP